MIDRDIVPNVQVSIIQKLDNAISIQWIMLLVSLILIRWKVIYPFDSALQLLNNRGERFPLNYGQIWRGLLIKLLRDLN